MRTVRLWLAVATIVVGMIIVVAVALDQLWQVDVPDVNLEDRDSLIAEVIQQIDESEIYSTVHDLQDFSSRHYGQSGNAEASTYLFDRLSAIPGLVVEYQGGDLRNVIATLPGANSSSTYMVGAHYRS